MQTRLLHCSLLQDQTLKASHGIRLTGTAPVLLECCCVHQTTPEWTLHLRQVKLLNTLHVKRNLTQGQSNAFIVTWQDHQWRNDNEAQWNFQPESVGRCRLCRNIWTRAKWKRKISQVKTLEKWVQFHVKKHHDHCLPEACDCFLLRLPHQQVWVFTCFVSTMTFSQTRFRLTHLRLTQDTRRLRFSLVSTPTLSTSSPFPALNPFFGHSNPLCGNGEHRIDSSAITPATTPAPSS